MNKRDLPLIGLMGYATAGKDEVADILVARFGYRKVSLSDPINALLMALNPIIEAKPMSLMFYDKPVEGGLIRYREYVDEVGYTEAKKHPEVRALLQRMGTDAGRKVLGDLIWVEQMLKTIYRSPEPCVVTNVRYREEANALIDDCGVLVLVDRPGVGPANSHMSEQVPADPDAVIHNDGSLADLPAKVEAALGAYLPVQVFA